MNSIYISSQMPVNGVRHSVQHRKNISHTKARVWPIMLCKNCVVDFAMALSGLKLVFLEQCVHVDLTDLTRSTQLL